MTLTESYDADYLYMFYQDAIAGRWYVSPPARNDVGTFVINRFPVVKRLTIPQMLHMLASLLDID